MTIYEVWAKVPASESYKDLTGALTISRFEKTTTSEGAARECVEGLRAVGLGYEVRTYEETEAPDE